MPQRNFTIKSPSSGISSCSSDDKKQKQKIRKRKTRKTKLFMLKLINIKMTKLL